MSFYNDVILPRLCDLAMRNKRLIPYRERVIGAAEGLVLEIGVGSGPPVSFLEASAESIPLDDGSVDTVVTTWTLCTVPQAATALGEMRRVLRQGGRLLFVEHGLAPDEGVRWWQDRLTPAWKSISGGCHLNRPMQALIEGAGFRVDRVETGYMPGLKPMTFMYEGSARPG